MTKCEYFALVIAAAIMLESWLLLKGHVLRRIFVGLTQRWFGLTSIFVRIPWPAYSLAAFVAFFVVILKVLPFQSAMQPCGPRGRAMLESAVKVAEILPTPFVSQALAGTADGCSSSNK